MAILFFVVGVQRTLLLRSKHVQSPMSAFRPGKSARGLPLMTPSHSDDKSCQRDSRSMAMPTSSLSHDGCQNPVSGNEVSRDTETDAFELVIHRASSLPPRTLRLQQRRAPPPMHTHSLPTLKLEVPASLPEQLQWHAKKLWVGWQ
jgi:hypothetical protein